jgi:thioredoxin 1
MTTATPAAPVKLLVACLCAQWCRTCDDYRPLFAQFGAEFPDAELRWIDIEDEADLVDPIEVDHFPTILIATDGHARFFGAVTPHIDTLRRLFLACAGHGAPAVDSIEVTKLLTRLQSSWPAGLNN